MPSYRLLRTTLGGYELINFDGALLAQFDKTEDLSAQLPTSPSSTATFTTTVPFAAGTILVFLGGVQQPLASTTPGTGTFVLPSAVDSTQGPLVVGYLAAP